jgi:hypothetical protein
MIGAMRIRNDGKGAADEDNDESRHTDKQVAAD